MNRGRTVVVAIVVALAFAAYGAWWLHAAGLLRQAVGAWVEASRAQGWQIELDGVAVRGFPFRLRASADRFSIGRDLPFAWRWSGPEFAASAPPWIGHEISLSFPGAHKIEFDARDGHKTIPISAAKAGGRVRVGEDGRIQAFAIDLGEVVADLPDLGQAKVARLRMFVGASDKTPSPPDSARAPEVGRLSLAADAIDLPPRAATSLGARVARVEAEIVLLGAIPAAHTEAALAAWRDAGGTVEMERLRLHWGEFQIEANGTAALDSTLQPQGALTVRIWGAGAAIDALVNEGSVRPREGATARIVLRAMAMAKPRTDQGIPPEVEVPLTMQDRKLYVGPVAIAGVPKIVWP